MKILTECRKLQIVQHIGMEYFFFDRCLKVVKFFKVSQEEFISLKKILNKKLKLIIERIKMKILVIELPENLVPFDILTLTERFSIETKFNLKFEN